MIWGGGGGKYVSGTIPEGGGNYVNGTIPEHIC